MALEGLQPRVSRKWAAQAIGILPAATMVLVIAALAALLWFMDRGEREEQRASLINDSLWVEQALHFAVQSDADDISRLASDIRQGLTPEQARPRLELMLRNSPEIASIVWYDSGNAIVAAVPGGSSGLAPETTRNTRQMALQSGQTVYSQAIPTGGGYGFELTVPIYKGLQPAGVLAAEFSLEGLLSNHIPWWVAQKYQVAFADNGGAMLASRTAVAPNPQAASHAIAFDPPGNGLTLTVTRFDNRTNLTANALVATIIAFSLLALASLVVTRRHMIRRGAAEHALQEEHALRKAMEECSLSACGPGITAARSSMSTRRSAGWWDGLRKSLSAASRQCPTGCQRIWSARWNCINSCSMEKPRRKALRSSSGGATANALMPWSMRPR